MLSAAQGREGGLEEAQKPRNDSSRSADLDECSSCLAPQSSVQVLNHKDFGFGVSGLVRVAPILVPCAPGSSLQSGCKTSELAALCMGMARQSSKGSHEDSDAASPRHARPGEGGILGLLLRG